jgi:hypothetical protein
VPKNNYWIADTEGVYASVEGADERDTWTKVHGWHETAEPGPTDQVHVVNENPEVGPGRLPYAAVELHAGLGWKPGPPPAPYDATKDPALVDQAPAPVTEPVKPKTPVAAGAADKKEQARA